MIGNLQGLISPRKMKQEERITSTKHMKNVYKISVLKPE